MLPESTLGTCVKRRPNRSVARWFPVASGKAAIVSTSTASCAGSTRAALKRSFTQPPPGAKTPTPNTRLHSISR